MERVSYDAAYEQLVRRPGAVVVFHPDLPAARIKEVIVALADVPGVSAVEAAHLGIGGIAGYLNAVHGAFWRADTLFDIEDRLHGSKGDVARAFWRGCVERFAGMARIG